MGGWLLQHLVMTRFVLVVFALQSAHSDYDSLRDTLQNVKTTPGPKMWDAFFKSFLRNTLKKTTLVTITSLHRVSKSPTEPCSPVLVCFPTRTLDIQQAFRQGMSS